MQEIQNQQQQNTNKLIAQENTSHSIMKIKRSTQKIHTWLMQHKVCSHMITETMHSCTKYKFDSNLKQLMKLQNKSMLK